MNESLEKSIKEMDKNKYFFMTVNSDGVRKDEKRYIRHKMSLFYPKNHKIDNKIEEIERERLIKIAKGVSRHRKGINVATEYLLSCPRMVEYVNTLTLLNINDNEKPHEYLLKRMLKLRNIVWNYTQNNSEVDLCLSDLVSATIFIKKRRKA